MFSRLERLQMSMTVPAVSITLTDLANDSIANDPVGFVIQIAPESIGWLAIVPILDSNVRLDSLLEPFVPLIHGSHMHEVKLLIFTVLAIFVLRIVFRSNSTIEAAMYHRRFESLTLQECIGIPVSITDDEYDNDITQIDGNVPEEIFHFPFLLFAMHQPLVEIRFHRFLLFGSVVFWTCRTWIHD